MPDPRLPTAIKTTCPVRSITVPWWSSVRILRPGDVSMAKKPMKEVRFVTWFTERKQQQAIREALGNRTPIFYLFPRNPIIGKTRALAIISIMCSTFGRLLHRRIAAFFSRACYVRDLKYAYSALQGCVLHDLTTECRPSDLQSPRLVIEAYCLM